MEVLIMEHAIPFPQSRKPARVGRSRRRWGRWLLAALLLAALAGGGLWWRASQTTTAVTTTTAAVTQGSLAVTVSGSGAVAAARSVDVPFQQSGTLTAVNVKVGDVVEAGQALAQIDTAALQLALQQAQANLAAAQASYAQVQSGSATEQDIVSAQAQVDSARAQLQQTKTGTTTKADLASAQAALESAQAKLDALKNPSPADLSAAQVQVSQAQTSLQTQRDSLSQAKTSAYNQMQQAVNSLTQAQSKYSTAKQQWEYVQAEGRDPLNPTTTNTQGEKVDNSLNDAETQQYYDSFIQAEAALKSAETAVQQAQVSYDTARQAEAAEVPLLEQEVANAQAQLDALKNPTASDLVQAQASVTQAQATLTNLKQGGTAAEVAQAQASVTQAQASLEGLTAPATESDLASAAASVKQAEVAVATAQTNLNQATLTAPFAGVVSAVSVVEGGTASSGTAAVTLVDESTLHIDVSLSETDAAKVQVGQPVALSFDALADTTITGTVTTIAPVASTEQNVVTYAVQVAFDPGQTAVKVGMSATADIQVEQVSDALLVPSRAVQTAGDAKTVTVQRGEATVAVPVTTGLTSDGKTAITSSGGNGVAALKVGDTVIVSGATTTTSQASTSSSRGGITGGLTGGPPPGP
jgi:HlyD family secretion protein